MTIAVLGLAFKPNIDDLRESPALEVAEHLTRETGARLLFVEPNVTALPPALQSGRLVELDIIAAVVIGGGSLSGGQGSILGAMIGALIMAFLRNGCQQVGWPNYIQEIIIGAIIVIAVAAESRARADR